MAPSTQSNLIDGRYRTIRELPLGRTRPKSVRQLLTFDVKAQTDAILTIMEGDDLSRRRFLSECAVARQLTSPGVLRILAAGEVPGAVYLRSDFPAAISLRQLLSAGELPQHLAMQAIWQLSTALVALHGRGLAHGGLDPTNVLVSPQGHLVLGGFMPAPARLHVHLDTAFDSYLRYAPPGVKSIASILPSGDIYSLGLIIYELLVGEPALPAADLIATTKRQQVLPGLLASEEVALPGVSRPFRAIMISMLHPDPTKRPQSILHLIPHLENAMAGTSYRALEGERLSKRARFGFRSEQNALLAGCRSALKKGEALSAATGLSLAGRMGIGSRERTTFIDRLMDCMWHTFLDLPLDEAQAICTQVARACETVNFPEFTALCRWRRDRLADPPDLANPPLLLPDSKIEMLQQALRQRPADEAGLLTLAIAVPGLKVEGETSIDLLKGKICQELNLHAAAILHASRGLSEPEQIEAVLRFLKGAMTQAMPEHKISEFAMPAIGDDDLASPPPLLSEGEPMSEIIPKIFEGEDTSPPPSPRLDPEILESLVIQSESLIASGDLEAAADILDELYRQGAVQVERWYSEICGQIQDFLWRAILPGRKPGRLDLALETVLRIARNMGLHSVVPIGETLLISNIPELEMAKRLAHLLRESSDSIPILQAASRRASSLPGEDSEWIRHLGSAGDRFLEAGELMLASKMFMALRALSPKSTIAERGLEKVLEGGQRTVAAGQAYEPIAAKLAENPDNTRKALVTVQDFLEKYPNHVPALEAAARYFGLEGNTTEAARLLLSLAKRALYREEEERAKEYLREVLRYDFESDEALLYLVVLDPPDDDAPEDVTEFKTWLFMREKLPEGAIYHTRKKLTGGATDLPILHKIMEIKKDSGEDPSSVLLQAGRVAWDGNQVGLARSYFDSAYRAAKDKTGLIEQMLKWEGIEDIFPMVDLLRASTDPGEALIPEGSEPGVANPLTEA